MNTSKQVNIMLGLIVLSIVLFGAYFFGESARAKEQEVFNTDYQAFFGAELYVNNCRGCHGMEGEGHVAPALNGKNFWILGADNQYGVPATPQGDADAVDKFLFETISCGRTNTFMPLWSNQFGGPLSPTQIRQITTLITNNRWDLVKSVGHTEDEHAGRTAKDVLVADAGSLSLTEKNCGQYTADNAADIRGRDPLSSGAPAAGATAAPKTTATAAVGGGTLSAAATEGRQLATANGCTACHSIGGAAGVGPTWKDILGRKTELVDGSTVTADEAYLKESITSPNAKVVKGFNPGIMPQNFGEKLNAQQVQSIVEYMKTLGGSAPAASAATATAAATARATGTAAATSTATAAAAAAADPAAVAEGKTLATSNGCAACHSTTGAAGVGPTWKGIAGRKTDLVDGSSATADDAYLRESIVSPNAKVVKGFNPGIMPQNFGEKLSAQQIQSLIAYMKSLQ